MRRNFCYVHPTPLQKGSIGPCEWKQRTHARELDFLVFLYHNSRKHSWCSYIAKKKPTFQHIPLQLSSKAITIISQLDCKTLFPESVLSRAISFFVCTFTNARKEVGSNKKYIPRVTEKGVSLTNTHRLSITDTKWVPTKLIIFTNEERDFDTN